MIKPNLEVTTLAGGCFWCTEAVFLKLSGVQKVESGYIGGKTLNPTYKDICTGETGHAEAIQITFDNTQLTFTDLLDVFFATHDPTTINRQGNDVGTQYRSEIFYHNDSQREDAENYIAMLNDQNTFGKKVVTKMSAATAFYPAEDYHQNFFERNPDQAYCNFVIPPKIAKLESKFADKLK